MNIESNKQLDIAEFNNFIAIFEKLKEKPNSKKKYKNYIYNIIIKNTKKLNKI